MSAGAKYDFDIDLSDRNNSHVLMLEMAGRSRRILEVGCATGYMSRLLADRGCEVVGLERDPGWTARENESRRTLRGARRILDPGGGRLLAVHPSADRSRQSGGVPVQASKEGSDGARRYYKETAGTAAQSSTTLTQRAVLRMLDAVGPVSGMAVDVGCGIGSNLTALQGVAERVLALDISSSALREARLHTAGMVPAMVADASRLPLRSGSALLVLCSEVLEHVSDLRVVLAEIHRILVPGGWLLVTSPSYLNPMGVRKKRMDRKLGGPRWEPWGSHVGGMERFMTPGKLKLALPSGFEIRRQFGIDHYSAWFAPSRPTAWLANRPAARALLDERIGRLPLFRSFGMHNCVIARKGR